MEVTVIRDDGVVGIDGIFRRVDLTALPGATLTLPPRISRMSAERRSRNRAPERT